MSWPALAFNAPATPGKSGSNGHAGNEIIADLHAQAATAIAEALASAATQTQTLQHYVLLTTLPSSPRPPSS
jgi:hypothetical protein